MSKIILSIDTEEVSEVFDWVRKTKDYVAGFKIHNCIIKNGIWVIEEIKKESPNSLVMADLKIRDIPKTIKKQIELLDQYSDIITVDTNCKYYDEDNLKLAGVCYLSNDRKGLNPLNFTPMLEFLNKKKYLVLVLISLKLF